MIVVDASVWIDFLMGDPHPRQMRWTGFFRKNS